jgi:hypothetical protein
MESQIAAARAKALEKLPDLGLVRGMDDISFEIGQSEG